MKIGFALLCSSLITVASHAAEPPVLPALQPQTPIVPTPPPAAPIQPGPRIQFQVPEYDFGKARSGDLVKFSFVFTNIGEGTLIISNVQPSCGCTTAGEWSKQVEAGQTGTIPVQFNSANYNGNVLKTVTVISNDKNQPSVMLRLKGSVWKPISVEPQFAVLQVGAESTNSSISEVKIVNNLEDLIDVWAPESNSKNFTTTLKTNTPGKEFQLTISTVPVLDAGNVQGQITVKSSSTNAPVITVTAWANVQQSVIVSPPQVALPAGALPAKQSFTVTLQNNTANPLTVTEPSVDAHGVDVQLAETQPGRLYTATLTFGQGFELAAGTRAELSLKSSSTRMPVIKVPIMQLAVAPAPQTPQIIPIKPAADAGQAAAPATPAAPTTVKQ